ncbi:metallophosphoesterase [Glycomyces harbinensis]|uniref:3',5'-cyclic AMP phosphodiesterase CpdA n=1 Tax=Glycomyces harbinensis TaxID=58114 RepID=A0A1G7BHX7_9ACTN|nr:metallophosphoesterase [Glycomyces harbinensis]SDE25855.1 3',5'-cyclic AMP phosphodiesterase CpdA [Glycomyces harbinensis]
MSLTLLHLSDPHLDGEPERAQRLRAVLDLLPASRRPDATVVTGDVADTGAAAAYDQFRAEMDGREPWLAAPGNHDHADRFAEAFASGAPVSALDVGRLRVIGIDVTVPGSDHGELRPDAAEAAAALAEGATATVLAFHQPPAPIGHAYIDSMPLVNPDALAGLVARIGTVAAILCGHAHTAAAATFAGVPLLLAPGIVSALGADPDRTPLTDREHPPGLALHRFDEDGTVTTSFHYAV